MKIRMLQDQPGSVDGINITDYASGAEYDMAATDGARELAASFLAAGMAEEVGAKPAADDPKPAKQKK